MEQAQFKKEILPFSHEEAGYCFLKRVLKTQNIPAQRIALGKEYMPFHYAP